MTWMMLVLLSLFAPQPTPTEHLQFQIVQLQEAVAKHKALEAASERTFNFNVAQTSPLRFTITPAVAVPGSIIQVLVCFDDGPPCVVPNLDWQISAGVHIADMPRANLASSKVGSATVFVSIRVPGKVPSLLEQRVYIRSAPTRL